MFARETQYAKTATSGFGWMDFGQDLLFDDVFGGDTNLLAPSD
jgi:hypothetical protein